MGFNPLEKLSDKVLKAKRAVATEFQTFVYQVLEMSIKSMKQKGVEYYKRNFICTALSMSFFRVPEFQSIFLAQLKPLGEFGEADNFTASVTEK